MTHYLGSSSQTIAALPQDFEKPFWQARKLRSAAHVTSQDAQKVRSARPQPMKAPEA
jgi:hypothetical protein